MQHKSSRVLAVCQHRSVRKLDDAIVVSHCRSGPRTRAPDNVLAITMVKVLSFKGFAPPTEARPRLNIGRSRQEQEPAAKLQTSARSSCSKRAQGLSSVTWSFSSDRRVRGMPNESAKRYQTAQFTAKLKISAGRSTKPRSHAPFWNTPATQVATRSDRNPLEPSPPHPAKIAPRVRPESP